MKRFCVLTIGAAGTVEILLRITQRTFNAVGESVATTDKNDDKLVKLGAIVSQ